MHRHRVGHGALAAAVGLWMTVSTGTAADQGQGHALQVTSVEQWASALEGSLPEGYGVDDLSFLWVFPEDFRPDAGSQLFHAGHGFWARGSVGWTGLMWAPVRLPTGALLTGYWVVYEDSDATFGISVTLRRFWMTLVGTSGDEDIGNSFSSAGTPGIAAAFVDIPDRTIEVAPTLLGLQSYAFGVILPPDTDVKLRGIIATWLRQVSPAPASATFSDVPTGYWAFRHVEALAASGITAGCGGGAFCPDAPLTRAQMAVFLAKALGLHWVP